MKKSTTVLIAIIALMFLATGIYIFNLKSQQKKAWEEINSKNEQLESEANMAASEAAALVPELVIEDVVVGKGAEVKSGDVVSIDYEGTLLDGTKFDSSYDRGEPFQTAIGVGQVIEGWDQGVVGMKVGGKRKLTIPAAMAYGAQSVGNIPPHSPLMFVVELKDIVE
jgi:FKBP-type peptidyl-prolyl cis-trans isomerase